MSSNENKKTTMFAVVGAVMLGLAVLTWVSTQPAQTTGFEKVGEEFFAEFQSSNQAGLLEVSAIDPDSARLQQFRVEEKDGLWTIPSHFGYPAEASDRLATTSSSLIGLRRESLVGRLKTDHERFGVMDPLSEDSVDPETAGKRITIKDGDDEVLVDLIIGKEAGEAPLSEDEMAFGQTSGRKNYYVRRPDENQTYKVSMDLELSTRFADWIRPDLLDLDGSELRRVSIDNYELEEQADPLGRVSTLYKKQGDQMAFTRDTGFGPWSMEGLEQEKQKLDSAKVDTAVQTLDDLRIVGVRKKTGYQDQQLLNADLTLNRIPELEQNVPLFRQIMGQLQQELSDYGFNLAPAAQGSQELTIVSNSGEMTAGTEEGVVYNLQFGNPVSGDENEIEIGSSDSSDKQDPTDPQSSEATDDPNDPASTRSSDTDDAGEAKEDVKNRYLMIRVSFDESLLGEKPVEPVEPVEPEKPEGYVPPPEDKDQPTDETQPAGDAPDEDESPNPTGETETAADSEQVEDDRPVEFQDYDLSKKDYDEKKTEYELELSRYQDAIKQFNEKVEAGQQRVRELNERFGAWFYVISADNLESLQLKREDLVSDKEPAKKDPVLPERPNINLVDPTESDPDDGETGNPGKPETSTDNDASEAG